MALPNPFAGEYRLKINKGKETISQVDIKMTDIGSRKFIAITSTDIPPKFELTIGRTTIQGASNLKLEFEIENLLKKGETIYFKGGLLYFETENGKPVPNKDEIKGQYGKPGPVDVDDDWTATRPPA